MSSADDPNLALRLALRQANLPNLVRDTFHHSLFRLLRRLPIDLAPAAGRWLTLREIRANRPWVIERARENLRRLRPELDDVAREALLQSFVNNLARFVGEVPTVGRQMSHGRVEIVGAEHLVNAVARGGTLLLALHLGNWEILGEAFQALGLQVSTFYEEAETPTQTRILREVRQSVGLSLLEPDVTGVRDALRQLQQGRAVGIFADEVRETRVMAPFFGRPPHREGNLSIAARLARRAPGGVVVCFCLRHSSNRFRTIFLPGVDLGSVRQDLLSDTIALNNLIEPIVLAHIDQWFFLDDLLECSPRP